MTKAPLRGAGVLVTRPAHLAGDLLRAVTDAGGKALPFPVIDIVPRASDAVRNDAAALPQPDVVVFVSRNAVAHGVSTLRDSNARLAAVGRATARALEAAGHTVDIVPPEGFDSEHLLAETALHEVAGLRIRIIRGNGGRELLARTLEERGATVDYLAVYRRETHRHSADELSQVASRWRRREIAFVAAMSVASLDALLEVLPAECLDALDAARLVTPSSRVIQTALERIPQVRSLLAAGPGATQMVEAMIAGVASPE